MGSLVPWWCSLVSKYLKHVAAQWLTHLTSNQSLVQIYKSVIKSVFHQVTIQQSRFLYLFSRHHLFQFIYLLYFLLCFVWLVCFCFLTVVFLDSLYALDLCLIAERLAKQRYLKCFNVSVLTNGHNLVCWSVSALFSSFDIHQWLNNCYTVCALLLFFFCGYITKIKMFCL